MNSEPLNINDERFLVNRLIEQAPTSTMIREFFKNADENACLAPEGNRQIKIYPLQINGVRKLAFWNTGVGMGAEELRSATDLSSSINKKMALDGNFGIGAKVSGLTMSPHGIRYRSCKDGTVHEVQIGFDDERETYVRFAVEFPDGKYETVYDVTDTAILDGKDISIDWTEVVLFGESEDHDTVAEPLGKGKSTDRSYITSTIFRRFAKFGPGVEVKIDTSMTKGGAKEETGRFRQLKPLESVLRSLPQHERCSSKEGITVHYIHDPKHEKHSHTLSAVANPATSSTTFCSLVHKGERYDIKTRNSWSSVAPNFGIPFGSKVLTIEIEIDDHLALPNQYRDGLTWPEDRSQMTTDDFAKLVRELMPDWVKDVIRSQSPQSDDNLDDIQADLQKLLDEFRVPTVTLTSSDNISSSPTFDSDDGSDNSDPAFVQAEFLSDHLGAHLNQGFGEQGVVKRAKNQQSRKAPEGARRAKSTLALERVPEIKILTNPDDIADKNLKGRAGRYYKETQVLFINGNYSAIDRMKAELEPELRNEADPEIVRSAILKSTRHSMAFRVGKATCFAISKRLVDDWTTDDLDRATSPESLSLAADDYKPSLFQTKKLTKDLIKAAEFSPDNSN